MYALNAKLGHPAFAACKNVSHEYCSSPIVK